MKKYIIALILSVCAIVGLSYNPTTFAESTNSTQIELYNPLNLNYANLNGVKDFDIAEDCIYLATSTGISKYNTTSHTNVEIATLANINKLFYLNSTLLAITDTQIVTINNSGEITPFEITNFDNADITYVDEHYVIAYTTSDAINVNMYSTDNQLANSYTSPIEDEYFISISNNIVYLMSTTNNAFYSFDYVNENLQLIENEKLNFVTKYALYTTADDYIVVTTDTIQLINKVNYSVITFNNTKASENSAFKLGQINTPSSIKYRDNKLYVLDSTNLNIQTLTIGESSLTAENVIISSFGGDLGRYYNANSLALKDDTIIYVSDYSNKRIQIIDSTNKQEINTINNVNAFNIILDEYNNMFFYTNSSTATTLHRYTLTDYKPNGNYTLDYFISGMCIDNKNNIYIVDYNANKVLTSVTNNEQLNFEEYFDLSQISVTANENTKIYFVNSLNDFVISIDDTLYLVKANKTISLESTILHFEIDFNQNIYALLANGKLAKYNFQTEQTSHLENFENCTTFALNQVNGKLYLFDNANSIINIATNSEFSNGIADFEHFDTTLDTATEKNYILNWANIDGYIFEYPNYLGKVYNTTGEVTQVVLLEQTSSDETFEYVLFTENNEYHFGYAKKADLDINSTSITNNPTKLVAKERNVNIYKFPTLLNQTIIGNFTQNQVITTYTKYPTTIDGKEYYVVNVNDGYGYVYAGDLVGYSQNYNNVIDADNASIKIHDHSENVAVYSTDKGDEQIASLTNNKRVHVQKYDKTSKFTYVTYLDDNGKQQGGYVLTNYIKMDSNNTLIITSIIIFVCGIILAIVIAVTYTRYKKKEKQEME